MEKANLLKLAIVGLGHAAEYQLQALKLTQYFILVAACDLDQDKQKIVSENVPFFIDYREMLKAVEADVFLVSTPYFTHYEIAKEILEAGNNVLLEKPATSTIEELEDLIAIAKAKDVVFSLAFHAAYGKELIWFIENYETNLMPKLGKITGFNCGFYDPYIVNGQILEVANSLGTSWIDSGINALSVVGKLLENIKLIETKFTYLPQDKLRDIQAIVDFSFSRDDSYRGSIETNWTLGINEKTTKLDFADTGNQVILNHSTQQVLIIDIQGNTEVIADYSQGETRLVNHYIGVLNAYYKNIQNRSNNLDFALYLHKLMYTALK